MQPQLVAKDSAVVDDGVEVLRMLDLLPRMVKINDLQLHLFPHHPDQMSQKSQVSWVAV